MSKRKGSSSACCVPLGELLQPRLFKALCDPNRIQLVARLASCGRECTVGEMAACCPVDMSVVSRHLAILRDAGIVEARREGKEVHYRIRLESLSSWLRALADALDACCPTLPAGEGKRK